MQKDMGKKQMFSSKLGHFYLEWLCFCQEFSPWGSAGGPGGKRAAGQREEGFLWPILLISNLFIHAINQKAEKEVLEKTPLMTGVRGIHTGQSLKVNVHLMGPSIPLKVIFNFRRQNQQMRKR